MDSESTKYSLHWQLRCKADNAMEIIQSRSASIGKSWTLSYSPKNEISNEYTLTIRTTIPGIFLFSGAKAHGSITSNDEGAMLDVDIAMIWPLKYFDFSIFTNVIFILMIVLSWPLLIFSEFIGQFGHLKPYIITLALEATVGVCLMIEAYLSKGELKTMVNFFSSTFSKHRSESNP